MQSSMVSLVYSKEVKIHRDNLYVILLLNGDETPIRRCIEKGILPQNILGIVRNHKDQYIIDTYIKHYNIELFKLEEVSAGCSALKAMQYGEDLIYKKNNYVRIYGECHWHIPIPEEDKDGIDRIANNYANDISITAQAQMRQQIQDFWNKY